MDLGLKGKTALVTGSTKGIGFAAALALAREGAAIIINGRAQDGVDKAVAELKTKVPGAKISGVAADVSKPAGLDALTSAIPHLDILVNNAGVFAPCAFKDIPRDEWLRMFETNVLAGALLTQHYLPRMIEKGWGRVIFVSSESALNIPVEMVHYGMSKTAQLAVARGAAETCKGTKVTVNSVLPGPTLSEGVGTFVEDMAKHGNKSVDQVEKDFFRDARPSSIAQRFAEPAEIADVIAFVASERAAMINGASVRADGGVYKSI
jgi:NAD(P)-dependent dehydrogenase (short-subunit alcohol dehydrogenase family)